MLCYSEQVMGLMKTLLKYFVLVQKRIYNSLDDGDTDPSL